MTQRIKVLHIITKLELGGAQQNTLYTVEHLDKQHFDVYLATGKGGILDNKAIELAARGKIKLFFVSDLVREINPFKDFICFIELFLLITSIKPDVVHTHSSKAGILGRWATKFYNIFIGNFYHKKIKIIHTFHGFAFSKFHNFFVKIFYIVLEFFTGIITDILIFVAKDNIKTARLYKIGFTRKYILIRSGIKIKEYYSVNDNIELKHSKKREFGIADDVRVITTIGAFKPQKNLSDFIHMVRKVCNILSEHKLQFIIVGDGEQRSKLVVLAKKLNVLNKIKFLSWYYDIRGLFAITDIFVMTSLWEGLPRAAVESLVSGVPVIAYAVDGLNDIIISGVNGFLIPPKDLNTMIEKVVLLLKNESLYKEIKKRTTQTIDNTFDIDYMVLQQENLLKLICGRR
ncbi:MAG: glycosyltransferase [Endomicrobia bacterium]|nr:glycosyltransferase [Endomicrobiia bacterium]MCX7941454.1 glycosyltransferase [Endomicrobiia bacterium]MDW8055442.1 glycosyltransferase [Elusimicrobiota bacterium]